MKIYTAYFCPFCNNIQDGAPHGMCEDCGSQQIQPLGWLVRPQRERKKWINRIYREKRDEKRDLH
jgi:hypothetical protein